MMDSQTQLADAQQSTSLEVVRADSPEQLDAVYALRYDAYRRVGAIPPNDARRFSDRYDLQPNTTSYLVHDQSIAVASVRANVYVPAARAARPGAPAAWARFTGHSTIAVDVFPEDIARECGPEVTLVESNRFVAASDAFDASLRYLTLLFRAICTNALAHDLDYVVTAVRRKHVLFYRKAHGMRKLSPPRRPDDLDDEFVLVGIAFGEGYPAACSRDPRLRLRAGEIARLAMA